MALPLAAVIPAVASLVGTGANMIQTGKLNKKGRAFTAEQNQLNRDQTWEMWNATNEFNLRTSDPAFQMQRMKDAGINPWSISGQPTKVEASNMQTQQFAPPEQKMANIDIKGATEAFMQGMMQKKQLEAMDAGIAKTNAERVNTEINTANTEWDINQKKQLFPTVAASAEADLTNKITSNQKIVEEIKLIGSNLQMNDQQVKNMQANVAKTLVEIKTLQSQQKLQEAETKAKQLANRLFENTLQSKIDAENAQNELMKNTSGMGKASLMQMPGIIIGGALKIINEKVVKPMSKPGWSEKFKD